MSAPAVSVVLPIYNGTRYLRESVDSVLAQTFRDFELLAWDDGSADDSRAVLASYRDPRVRAFANPANRGLFPTLNLAVRECRGGLVRLWAQDDRMLPHCLEREVEYWARHPGVGMTYCQHHLIDAVGTVVRRAPDDGTPDVVEPWLASQISYYWGSMPGNISTVTLKKSVLDRVGPFAPLRVSGDFEMWARVMEHYPVGFIREPLVELRAHAGQFSRWSGEQLNFIREDRQVLERLFERLPEPLRRHARSYHLRRRVITYVHCMMRALAAGQFRYALQVLAEVRREGNVAWLVFLWLVTGNGRWFRPEPVYRNPAA